MSTLTEKTRAQREQYYLEEMALMQTLAQGQHPQVLYIGCSDSRIMPGRILGAQPGDVFVMRNVANVVPPAGAADRAVGAVIEYAVRHLHVPHIVVCGHAQCGGIQSLDAAHNEAEPALSHWLDYARPARDYIAAGLEGPARLDAIIEANVLLQIANLRTYPCVHAAEAAGDTQLHAWVYDFRRGVVRIYDQSSETFIEEAPFDISVGCVSTQLGTRLARSGDRPESLGPVS